MLSNAPLSAPQDLAWFLASYARDAKARVETHKDLPRWPPCAAPWKKPWA